VECCQRCGAPVEPAGGDGDDALGPLRELAGIMRGSSETLLCAACREEDGMLGTALIDDLDGEL